MLNNMVKLSLDGVSGILIVISAFALVDGKNVQTTLTPVEVKQLDYEAIREKVLEVKRIIINGLESIKADALEDHSSSGRTIADLVKNSTISVNKICEIVEGMINDKSLTKQSAKIHLRKVEREMGDLKSKVVKEIQGLNSNTVIKILNKAVECYQNVLQLTNEISDLLDG